MYISWSQCWIKTAERAGNFEMMFHFKLLCSQFLCSVLPLSLASSCLLQMVLYKQTGILPSGRKVIPKQKFGRDEQLSGRTCCRPCSFLGSWLSSASFTRPNSPDEIKAPKCFHISLVPSLCQCSRVWLRLSFFLWRYQVTWL